MLNMRNAARCPPGTVAGRQGALAAEQHQVIVVGTRDPHEALQLRRQLEQALAMPERQHIANPPVAAAWRVVGFASASVGCTAKH